MIRKIILHPFLLAIYPVIGLYTTNLDWIRLDQVLRSLVVLTLLTTLALIFFQKVTKDWGRAGLIVSLWLVIFLGYGHALRFLDSITQVEPFTLNRILASLSAAVLIIGTWVLIRIIRSDVSPATFFLNVGLAVAILLTFSSIGSYAYRTGGLGATNSFFKDRSLRQNEISNVQRPDIYYIILDAYTRADILEELFNYDNSSFIDFLEENGFFVAENSHSNYSQTAASLASSLNYEYVNYVGEEVGFDETEQYGFGRLVRDNKLQHFLKAHDYRILSISSGFEFTQWTDADLYISPGSIGRLNDFEAILLLNTFPGTVFSIDLRFEQKRQRVLHSLDSLSEVAKEPGPKFVLAHILSPHAPMVFGPNGEKIRPHKEFDLNEIIQFGFSRDAYLGYYGDELTFLNKRLTNAIQDILEQSESPPIIIIQGDHGSRAYLNWGSEKDTCMKERLSILYAIYLPEQDRDLLYDTITPVNTFRVILNTTFDAEFEMLEDRSYFSLWEKPYEKIEVTDRLEEPCD